MAIQIKSESDDEKSFPLVEAKPDIDDHLRALGPSPPFRFLCKALQVMNGNKKIKQTFLSQHRRQCLLQFFETWRKMYGNNLYPCIRLLLPDIDRERPTYFLKELKLARLYCDALGANWKTSPAVQRIINWKADAPNGDHHESMAGEFSKLLVEEIKKQSEVEQTLLSIDDINKQLDALAAANSSAQKLEIVKVWLQQVSPDDHLWLIRIILQDLQVGMSTNTVLSCLHKCAPELFNICTDIKVVCHTLYSPTVLPQDAETRLKPFKIFKPMLAKRSAKDLPDIVSMMLSGKHKEFLIEEKMDGERMQLHKSGEKYQFWSRTGKDYTYLYGADPSTGLLTPYIHTAFKSAVDEVILDGEMLAWDPQAEKIMRFGSVKSLKSTDDGNSPRALFKVFDILYLKGKGKPEGTSFVNKPLLERRQVMESGRVFEEVGTRFEICYNVRGQNTQDVRESLQKILEQMGEGLIIKRLDSRYLMNGRTDDWYKVKPDYMDELGETFEALAIGGFWGRGKRGGKLGSFLVALIDKEKSERSQGVFCYKTLCSVGTGLSVHETEQVMSKLEGKYHEWDKKRPGRNPDWLDFGPGAGVIPDVWWHLQDSFLLTIKGAEIIPSGVHGCQFSIRFPRAIRFDIDRDIEDCMSYEDLLGIKDKPPETTQFGNDLSGHARKRKKRELPQPRTSLRPLKRSDSSKIFYGAEFWVLEGLDDLAESKSDLELMLNRNGGKIIHNVPRPAPEREHFCVTRRTDSWNAEKAIRHGLRLIHPQWVGDSAQAGCRLDLATSKYDVHIAQATDGNPTPEHTRSVAVVKDESNSDSGQQWPDELSDVTVQSEDSRSEDSNTIDEVSDDEDDSLARSPLKNLELSVSAPDQRSPEVSLPNKSLEAESTEQVEEGIFYPLVFYVDSQPIPDPSQSSTVSQHTILNNPDSESSQLCSNVCKLIKAHGGKIVFDLGHPDVTHIVCCQSDSSRCSQLIRMDRDRQKKRRLVRTDWVIDSVDSDACLYEADYVPY